MKHTTDEELTYALQHIYEAHYNAPTIPTIYEMIVVNRLLCFFDNDIKCGIKELNAELLISKGTASKVLTKLLNNKLVTRHNSEKDKRRYYYLPTELLLNERRKSFSKFRQALQIA